MKKKILIIFGTRPEAIKMAPLVKELQKYSNQFDVKVCVTAQHREMLDQVLNIFEIIPDYDLNIMKKGQDLYDITSRVLIGLKDVIKDVKPDIVFVHGDTTTSTFAALAAFYKKIPVAHIEAGLRTDNMYSPWPEEINRRLTGRLTTYHFSPTNRAKENLLKENVKEEDIIVTGNTVIDSLYFIIDKIKQSSSMEQKLRKKIATEGYNLSARKIVLITAHRRENFGVGFVTICKTIKKLAFKYQNLDFVYPVHLNPNVKKPVYKHLNKLNNVYLIEPLEYLAFIFLMQRSYIMLTDSGGIQEEAPSLGIPVLVMRDTTERPEAVDAGTVKLVGTNKQLIIYELSRLIDNDDYYNSMSIANNPYGDGKACQRISKFLRSSLVI